MTVTRLETGTYTRFQTPDGDVEVFKVTEVGGTESDGSAPLTVGKFYYAPTDGSDPGGPFDTEEEAVKEAY
jgi:hypothetical protein